MKKRVNNDLKQTLTILRDGVAEIFTDATNIELKAYIPNLYNTEMPFTRVDNVLSVAAPANTLKIGVYTYVLTYNKPDVDFESGLATYTIDFKDAFEIVRHTEDEDAEGQNLSGNVGDAVLPGGGNLGDMLVKKSDASNDFEWLPVLTELGTNTKRPVSQKLVTDQLALKIDKSSIANNLTETDAGKVLDARQGKALNEAKVDKVTGKQLSTEDYTTTEKNKLSGIAENANNYTHPANHQPSIITQDTDNRFVTDAEKSTETS